MSRNGSMPQASRQPGRGYDEMRKPQSYPAASQPTQRQPGQPRPGPGRQQPPTASQPRHQPPSYTPTDRSNRPPSASQPRQGNPQKKKPRVAVSAGAPKPYQPLRQPTNGGPPRYGPPSASQPRSPSVASQPRTPSASQPRTPSQTPTPRDYSPATTPRSTSPRSATPRSPTPRGRTPTQQHPPSPHHSNNNIAPGFAQPKPTYKNPPPREPDNLKVSPAYDDDDLSDEEERPLSDFDMDMGSKKTMPYPEKKNGGYEGFSDDLPAPKKSSSKHHLTPQQRPNQKEYKKIYGPQRCGGHRRLCIILVVLFILLLIIALILGISLSTRGDNFSGTFADDLGKTCNMMCLDPSENGYSRRAVLMVALDGFRPEFMNKTWEDTIPNIHRLAECGSLAVNMEPSYPSTTYPNLYTLVTGLYPAVHGIIADYMSQNGTAGTFDPRRRPDSPVLQSPSWYKGKPIWQTAKEQGVITGSHSWIGNNVHEQNLGGIRVDANPDYYVQRNSEIDFLARMQSALNWFTRPSNKAKFVNVFMEEPGETLRRHAVNSEQVKTALMKVDDAIGLFMENLAKDKATDCFNVVIVSTSGYLGVSCSNTTYFDEILPNTLHYDIETNDMNSMAFLTPTHDSPTSSDTPEELVTRIGCQDRPFEAYTRDTVPSKYHFFNPDREESAVIIMDDWHTFAGSQSDFDREECTGARGGYSTTNPEMKGVLIGFGPSFKNNYIKREGFTNLQVYNLISELIDVEPETNNGTHGVLNDLLQSPEVPLEDVENTKTYFESKSCLYPDTMQRNQRRAQDETGCTCTPEDLSNISPAVNINTKDELLDISSERGDILIREDHAPLGEPMLVDVEGAIGTHNCRLVQDNYMTVFENKLMVPLFVSYKVKSESNSQMVSDCLRYDVRLEPEDSPKCTSFDITDTPGLPEDIRIHYLIPQSMAGTLDDKFNILITSNVVPMYDRFVAEVWSPLHQRLKDMASGGRNIMVVSGPVFDSNRDGVRDTYKDIAFTSDAWVGKTPMPTHYFVVVTRCGQSNQNIVLCSNEDLEAVAYIFPHTNGIKTCDQTIEDYMGTYQASITDVERITGLHLFSDLEDDDKSEEDLEWLMALKMSREPFRS